MTAPAIESVEQGQDRGRVMHLWCMNCLPEFGLPARAFCGYTTDDRNNKGGPDKCVVCKDLESSTCERCGW